MAYVLVDAAGATPEPSLAGLALEVFPDDDPCPRVGITITGLSLTAESVVTVWRTSPGEARTAVRGLRRTKVVDATYVVDYEAPLARPVTYTLEVAGPVQPGITTATVTVPSDRVWMQDPLAPHTAVPVATWDDGADTWFSSAAFAEIGYPDPGTLVRVMGSRYGTALGGGRWGASNVPFDVYTSAIEAANRVRTLLEAASPLLVRTIAPVSPPLPALAYVRADATEQPVDSLWEGGTVTYWSLRGDLVAAPSINLLVPTWTYIQVEALWETYTAAQARGGTYLDWMKDPTP
jgi:hypothetical protein